VLSALRACQGHTCLIVIFGGALVPGVPTVKPPGIISASSFKHKLYCKRASYLSVSLDHRLLLTGNILLFCFNKYS
jgi:hypothetical protein